MKTTAFDELNKLLLSTGTDQNDIDHLLARFLEEEAYEYVECMEYMKEELRKREKENTGLLS